jgi:hypothetical protein
MPFTNAVSGLVPLWPAEGSTQDVVLRLRRGATLTGILTDSYRATPIRSTGFTLRLFDFAGINSTDRSTATDAQGRYRVPGLPPGAYRLQVTVRFPYYTTMRYPGIECLQPADCPPNSGSSVTVNGGAVVDNLGFELTPGAVLTGRITEQATGAPVPGIEVRAYQTQIFIGTTRVASATTGADGRYAVTNIPIEYATRLGTANSAGYVDVGWPAAPCNTPDCVEGSSIAALSGVSTAAYDFAITAGRAISGEITIPGAAPGSVPGEVSIYQQVGTQMVSVWTGAISVGQSYTTRGLAEGAYFARARLGDACVAYAQQNCTAFQLPDAATATPIVLPEAIGTYPGVDFAFPTLSLFGNGFESVGASTPPATPARSHP